MKNVLNMLWIIHKCLTLVFLETIFSNMGHGKNVSAQHVLEELLEVFMYGTASCIHIIHLIVHTNMNTQLHLCPLWTQIFQGRIHGIERIKLLTYCWEWVWLCRGGYISWRMRDGTWGGFNTQTSHMEPSVLCQPDSKLFYASGALIFHTVSSHYSPFPQRKIAGMKKRLPVIDWSTALLNSGYKLREMRREGEQWGGGWGWRPCTAGGCTLVSLR